MEKEQIKFKSQFGKFATKPPQTKLVLTLKYSAVSKPDKKSIVGPINVNKSILKYRCICS